MADKQSQPTLEDALQQTCKNWSRLAYVLALMPHKEADALVLNALRGMPYRKMMRHLLMRSAGGVRKSFVERATDRSSAQ